MKIYHAVVMLALLTFSSCMKDMDGWIGSDKYPLHDPEHNYYKNYFFPLMDENDVASIYGAVNDNDNISVIASGSTFEISGIPQDIFLAPFPGGTIEPAGNNMNMLRDVIPYTHEEYRPIDEIYNKEVNLPYVWFDLMFEAHSMTYNVRQGEDVHTVCVTFGPEHGKVEFRPIGATYYWAYEFGMMMKKMTVDGEEWPLPKERIIMYKLYYNRFKDSIG